jgi:septum formation protein
LPLILASTSPIRRQMLAAAGVAFDAVSPDVDESAAKQQLGAAESVAIALAKAKALSVSADRAEDWVIGSDSIVTVADRLFDKPKDRDQAAEHLRFFSGKIMRLTSAAALARAGTVDWGHQQSALLRVRPLSDAFIAEYLDAEWPEVGYCVGVFRLEGRGVQLFDTIEGSFFTILGMPLLPLLAALRERGVMSS